jgi:spore coat protein U-like protein
MKQFLSLLSLLILVLALPGRGALAATCSVNVQPLVFGAYQPLALAALDGTADLTVTCARTSPSTETVNYTVGLSVGAGSFSAREMTGSGDKLLYNLYSDPARITVWGDGAGAGLVAGQLVLNVSGPSSEMNVHPVYGRIYANQPTVRPGLYTSSAPIMVTVTY